MGDNDRVEENSEFWIVGHFRSQIILHQIFAPNIEFSTPEILSETETYAISL